MCDNEKKNNEINYLFCKKRVNDTIFEFKISFRFSFMRYEEINKRSNVWTSKIDECSNIRTRCSLAMN